MAAKVAFQNGKIELKCIINISRRTLETVMDAAVGGTGHWVSQMLCADWLLSPDYLSRGETRPGTADHDIIKKFLDGREITVRDSIGGKSHILTTTKLMDGIRAYLQESTPPDGDFLEWVDHELRVDTSYITDEIADSIVQYAIFNRIVYKDGVRL